ncbi:metallophosphoesterase [Candidatus Woesearchaeota archaeon]|nr:metallophosphoesterase [Candidatus Woesearchaeota archaeon]
MKILAFVDTHGNNAALDNIIIKSKEADILICAGDLTSWGSDIKKILEKLKTAGKPMLVIAGNHEIDEELKKVCESFGYIAYIDKGSYEFEDYIFLGYGGGGFSTRDQRFEQLAKQFAKHITKEKKVILITHAPPYGTKLDDMGSIGHRGCKSIMDFIEKHQPILSISGHLHETAGRKQMIGKTLAINPGPLGKLIKI